MNLQRRQPAARRVSRTGFTLVEMLVAIALVLLMMTMFAEIFSIATGTMSKQKGLAELDQRQRLFSTIIRDDLRQRSFRTLFAFHQSDSETNVQSASRPINIPFGERLGYFYISENDTDDDTDDVLQYTVTRKDGTLFYGRTKELLDPAGGGAASNPNQPENDDGSFYGEGLGVGSSPSAEVSYFLRNGILYRRVLLIRKPTDATYLDVPSSGNDGRGVGLVQSGIYPQSSSMGVPFYVSGGTAANRYPDDFDFSATNESALPPAGPQLTILAQGDMSNGGTSVNSLGRPYNRFGFQRATGNMAIPVGRPLEYIGTSFIGRYTHEETSHPAFGWPGDPGLGSDGAIATGDDTNPYTRSGGLAVSPNGVVTLYAGGPRQGEDILLTNVRAFDVKIWDPAAGVGPDGQPGLIGIDDDGNGTVDDASELGALGSDDGAFVDIGHAGMGHFSQASNQNAAYGPLNANNRCFDTWHPSLAGTLGAAPFRPVLRGPDGQPGVQTDGIPGGIGDDDLDGVDDNAAELGWANSDDIPIPIKAIQIRIRYVDQSTNMLRDLTIIESLTPGEL